MIHSDHPDFDSAVRYAHYVANRTGRDVGVKAGSWGLWPNMLPGWYCTTDDILGSEYVALPGEIDQS